MKNQTAPKPVYSPITHDGEVEKYRACYRNEKYGTAKSFVTDFRSPELNQIEPGSTYLDVSCGRGESIKYVIGKLEGNVFPAGTELVPELCGDFGAYAVVSNKLPNLDGLQAYDYVSCWEVLEHLPVHDVIPAVNRLLSLTNKKLFVSANDRRASGGDDHGLVLHLSRFPLRWWLNLGDELARGGNFRFKYRNLRPDRPDTHRWVFSFDKTQQYERFDERDVNWSGYEDTKEPFWFWYCPEFPVSELLKTPESTQFELPKVKALHKDLDLRGIRHPILVHNIPGQPTRRYWTRCGNHRRNWAIARGKKTIPAIVYGGCEFEPCMPLSIRQANKYIKDGKISFVANQPPDVINVREWDDGQFPNV